MEIIPPIPDLPADKFTVESGETYNNGHGDVTVNEGGTVNENYGYIKDNYGTVNTNHLGGTIENNYGTVANDKGTYQHEGVWQYSVINNFGTVNSGASCSYIQNHFWTGPTSTIPNAKNYYHELIIDGKLSVSSTNGGDTKDGNGSKWIKAYSEPDDSPENKFDYYYYTYTVTPAEGWILDNDNKPSNCDFSDNGDGTWTIEYIGGEIKLVAKPDPSYVPPAGSGGEPGIPDPGEQEPEVSNPYSVPATADNSNMPLWSALFIVFAAAAIVTRKKKFD